MSYQISLPIFEGPFDLLFHLIEKNEVDIYDIPIAHITAQYLDYIQTMQKMDLDVASEFLVMAANLVAIKAKMLLPKLPKETAEQESEIDPRDELVERLLEYKKFKCVADHLKEREKSWERVYTRPNEDEMYLQFFSEENPLEGIEMINLMDALKDVLDRLDEKEFVGEVQREEFSIRDKMKEINRRLVFQPNGIVFKELFRGRTTRVEVVVTFLALLELIKLRRIQVYQSKLFGEIMIYRRVEEIA